MKGKKVFLLSIAGFGAIILGYALLGLKNPSQSSNIQPAAQSSSLNYPTFAQPNQGSHDDEGFGSIGRFSEHKEHDHGWDD